LLHHFIKNTKKISFLLVAFTCLLLALLEWVILKLKFVLLSNKGERAWKMLGTILVILVIGVQKSILPWSSLEFFFVGISSWNRYVLDTIAGGNFLGTLALEACTLIESLVRIPPIHVVKIEITLEEVIEKLGSLEKKFAKYPW
jgi:hypothetical protein